MEGGGKRTPKLKKTKINCILLGRQYKMTENQEDFHGRLEKEIADLPYQEFGRFQRLLERRGRDISAASMQEGQ